MADFALASLGAKLVSFLSDKHLSEKAKVEKRVQYIQQLVKQMRDSLAAAESMEEDRDLEQEMWILRVRSVVYEMEDFVDDVMLRVEAEGKRENGWFHSKEEKSIMNLHIVKEVKRLKSRFEELSVMNSPYTQPYSAASKNLVTMFSEVEAYRSPMPEIKLEHSEAAELRKRLVNLLISDGPKPQVISLLGIGGVGKTTLAEQVYHDVEMKSRFESHAWVHVSPTCKAKDVLKQLIKHVYKEDKKSVPGNLDRMDRYETIQVLSDFLSGRSYMIVLDDVWGLDAWERIRDAFPLGKKKGSRVVITTRVAEVAYASCTSKDHVFQVNPLTADESWALFSDKAFGGGQCPDHLVEISKKIVDKCDGLPLAIVALSGVLGTKDVESQSGEWSKLNHLLEYYPSRSLPNLLSISYLNLPHDLRACWLYTTIFHEDHPIAVPKLLRLWIAEGFVVTETGKTAEDVAKRNLEELLKRNLMQVEERASDGRVKACRIHDLLRETIVRKSRNHNFATISKASRGAWPDKVRRLSVHNSIKDIRDQDLGRVRSLLMFEVEEPISKKSWPAFFTGGCMLLTVLDLQGTSLSKFPSVILDMLSLKYLSLRSTKVDKIPSSIGTLTRLETLDLKCTPVSKLPKGILKLRSLRNLLAYRVKSVPFNLFNTKFGAKVPKHIGDLTSLQKLCFVDGGPGMKVMLAGLGRLTMLRRLGIINLIHENCATLGTSLDKLSNLHALSVNCANGELLTLPSTFHPRELRRVYLAGQLYALPHWIGSLQKLVKIFLKFSNLQDSPLAILAQLPELVHLELLQAYNGSELCFQAGKFQKLKILGIVEFSSLESVIIEKTAAPNLERLTLDGCRKLETLPRGIEHLLKLKELHFVNMPQKLTLSIRSDTGEKGEKFEKASHIPEITNSTHTMDAGWNIKKLSAVSHSGSVTVSQAAKEGVHTLQEK